MAIIDSQSVKTTEQGGPKGKDAFKMIDGRKRHILVNTLGMILAVVVHSAGIQVRDGARPVLEKIKGRFPRLRKILADGIYYGGFARGPRSPPTGCWRSCRSRRRRRMSRSTWRNGDGT
jgi:Transposase DDE domain